MAIYNGAAIDESALLFRFPGGEGACANATGACTQLVRARSGSALVRLLSSPRDDGTSSRLSMLYFTIDAADDGFFYSLWERSATGEVLTDDLQARRAAGWTVSSETMEGGAQWPGDPSEWTESVPEKLRASVAAGLPIDGGEAPLANQAAAMRTDPSSFCGVADEHCAQ